MDGRIYTFYSYKGGVGRSMALANVAEYFYLQGLRVLIIDWDLEAPGLESFFYDDSSGVERVRGRLGLLDLLGEYRQGFNDVIADRPSAKPLPTSDERAGGSDASPPQTFGQRVDSLLQLKQFVYQLHGPLKSDGDEGLWLMSAGWRQGDRFPAYAQSVQAFDWDDFYRSYQGHEFFDWFAGQLRTMAHVILIDSRTGVTEMGGVCARHLADVVVSFCAPNAQNLHGVDRMVKSWDRDDVKAARRQRPLDSVIVPTRIEGNETEKLTRFLKDFEQVLDSPGQRPSLFNEVRSSFRELQVPYVPAYAFREGRVYGPEGDALTQDPRKQLEAAYSKLALHLALLAPEGHPLRQKMADQVRSAFPQLLPAVVLTYAAEDGRDAAAFARDQLESAKISMWPDLPARSGEPPDFEKTLSQSRILVVVATLAACASRWIRAEVQMARRLGRLVVALVPPGMQPNALPKWLTSSALLIENDVTGLQSLVAAIRNPPPVLRAPNLTPVLPEHFVPRPAETAPLKTMLMDAAETPSLSVIAIGGLGGSGKTTLAAALCRDADIELAYLGGILWLDVKTADAAPLVAQVSMALTGEPGTSAEVLKRRLASTSILFVVDDCSDVNAVEELHTVTERGAILLISRDLSVAQAAGARVYVVGGLSDEEADALVETGQTLSPEGVSDRDAVVYAVEGWPLALALARQVVQQRIDLGQSADAAWNYAHEMFERHGVTAFDRRGDPAASVRAALQASLRTLGTRPDDEKTLLEFAQRFGTDSFGLAKAYVDGGRPLDKSKIAPFEATIRRLAARGLLQYDGVNVRVHPVVYRFLVDEARIEHGEEGPKQARIFSSSRDKQKNADVAAARAILGGRSADLEDQIALVKRLKAARYFDYARRLLVRLRSSAAFGPLDAKRKLWFGQQLALCTYKDTNLLPEHRFTRALEILHEADDLSATKTQETLGLAGAIYKYRWMYGGKRDDLERSLSYYMRGAAEGIANDEGYTAINAAYLLDLLASQEEYEGTRIDRPDCAVASVPPSVLERRRRAAGLRQDIVATLAQRGREEGNWWIVVTLAEAAFGLGTTPEGDVDQAWYDEAQFWFREALAQKKDDWELETTARQLASIATMQGGMRTVAKKSASDAQWNCLRVFVENRLVALRSLSLGKVGLALSGGGFRASLFHIGVLARLAEADVLRHVEVLSCVSGGSIIGAHYYLELRKCLESTEDGRITRQHYIEIVQKLERDFLFAVQRNLRTRVAANPIASARMMTAPYYSRTERMGELYEREIYAKVSDGHKGPRFMNDMLIVPAGEDRDSFAPKLDNWTRAAKVPELILNATTVNTGHNWQFTASWMGESPAGISEAIDGNDRLRRMYYWEAPEKYKNVRLGHAVAASSCVPGLFEPLAMPGLFPDRVVELVDGGVHDNQGLSALVEQDCKILLVSDASGQMANEDQPNAGVFSVFQRSNDMLMGRVRESQFRELIARKEAAALGDFMFVHLKKDLQTDPVDWEGCDDPYDPIDDARPAARRGPLTGYGILRSTQEQLAAIRTDLDSFTDLESYALMYSGYKMIDEELERASPLLASSGGEPAQWQFTAIDAALGAKRSSGLSQRLSDNLDVGRHSAWKILRPRTHRTVLTFLVAILLLGALAVFSLEEKREQIKRIEYLAKQSVTEVDAKGALIDLGKPLHVNLENFKRVVELYNTPLYRFAWPAAVRLAGYAYMLLRWLVLIIAFLIALAIVTTVIYRFTGRRKSLTQAILGGLLFVAAPLAWLHLLVFDSWYLRWGRLKRFRGSAD